MKSSVAFVACVLGDTFRHDGGKRVTLTYVSISFELFHGPPENNAVYNYGSLH